MKVLAFFDKVSRREMLTIDGLFVLSLVLVIMIGLIMLSSASVAISFNSFGYSYYYLVRQVIYIVIAIIAGTALLYIPTDLVNRWGIQAMLFSLFLLVLVLVPGIGREVNGSQRWISLGLFNLQASEVAKMCMVIYISGYLVRRADNVRESFKGFILPLVLCTVFAGLLMLEPDFGATVVLIGTVLALLFLGGAKVYQYISIIVFALLSLVFLAFFEEYRVKRLMTYLDPWSDPFNDGYQLTQALIAYGRGEWFGLGLGNSVQKLSYLPEAHTDFVFSIWVEETGMLGGILLILCFALLISRVFKIGNDSLARSRPFTGYLCYGFAILLVAQVIINVGVNTGLLPTKGLTLPLVSYGGSSMIMTLMTMFIVARVDIENKRDLAQVEVSGHHKSAIINHDEKEFDLV